MPEPQIIAGLSEVAPRFDAALVDVWGVVHNGRAPFMSAVEACRRFRDAGGVVALVSNSPRPSAEIPGQFTQFSVPNDFYDAIVTSGDATRAALAVRAPGPAYKIGPDRDEAIYDGLGLSFGELEEAAFITCTGPRNDEVETPADYAELFEAARARDLEMVCANPDIIVQRGDKTVYCGGALAQAYEAIGGRIVLCGKPHAPIYELALKRLEELRGGPVARERILAIGDGPDTDLAGANAQAIPALFIAGGIHGGELMAQGVLDAMRLGALLAAKERRAGYAMAALAW